MSQSNIRKHLTKNVVDISQALKGVEPCGDVVSSNITTAVYVESGNIIRITVAAGAAMHVAFGDNVMPAVSATTSPAIRLPIKSEEYVHYLLATDDYIRADINAVRVEVIRT